VKNYKEIEENPDKVNWYYISIDQKLSEDFIARFQNKVNWNNISKHQKLDDEFWGGFKLK